MHLLLIDVGLDGLNNRGLAPDLGLTGLGLDLGLGLSISCLDNISDLISELNNGYAAVKRES